MRIAQVAPLFERVPPEKYGGTERVVSNLTEKLVDLGHDVTLYASGDSITRATLASVCPRALRLHGTEGEASVYHSLLLEKLFRHVGDYDIIHFHVDYLAYPFLRRRHVTHVSTLHGRLDLKELAPLYGEYSEMPVISISQSQRAPLPWLNWVANVHHGLPVGQYRLAEGRGDYLAFLGRVSPEKGLARAIEIAERAGMRLRVAAKIDPHDREYYESKLRPRMRRSRYVEFIGEIGEEQKQEFLGGARALLFPIDWPEPFGMVMIEAMACGTPVIAIPGGSVPEVIEDGVSGLIVRNVDEAIRAVERVGELSRAGCRRAFETRFTDTRMAADYLHAYCRCIDEYESVLGFGDYVRGARGRDYPAEGSILRPGDVLAS